MFVKDLISSNWHKLLFLILGQFFIKYMLFEPYNAPITLNVVGLSLLSLATICLAAAGYIIKGIYKLKTAPIEHTENRQKVGNLPVKKANKLFFIFNIVGVLIGFYLANIIGHPGFSILFILASALLYTEASTSKKQVLIGPIILSCLTGLSLLSVGLFDLFPAINNQNSLTAATFFSIIVDYSILITLLNFARELMVKQKNINRDHKSGQASLPILLGKERTNKIIFVLLLFPIAGVIHYTFSYLYRHIISLIYVITLILAPLFYVLIRLIKAKTPMDYKKLNGLMKSILFFTILSIGLYQFILK